jgi:hypothetical protein
MIYYELSKAVADHYHNGARYWVSNSDAMSGRLTLLQHSERAWEEEGDVVKFIKNRHTGLMTPVDMREFFLVKLQARNA